MKTIEKAYNAAVHAENLEDIVFEGRNQTYGAYSLRRNYNNRVNLSMLAVISFAVLLAHIAFVRTIDQPPVQKPPQKGTTVVYFDPENPDDLMPQLPKVELPKNIKKVIVYELPTEIGDAVEEDEGIIIEPFNPTIETFDPKNAILIPIGPEGPSTGIPDDTKEPWEVHEPPIFDGDFSQWLAKHINYPEIASNNDIFGTVTLKFAIDVNGKVCDITIIKGIHPLLDEAVIHALNMSPNWKPAKYNGNPVKSFFYVPVKFNLQSSF